MSNESTCKQTIQSYLDQLAAIGLFLGKSKLKLFEKNSSKQVFETLSTFNMDGGQDRPHLEALDPKAIDGGLIAVPASGGETYFMKEINGSWKISDVELPCNCAMEEDSDAAGKCMMCEGSGKTGDETCTACSGNGVCVECEGSLKVSLAKTLEKNPREHDGCEDPEHHHETETPFKSIEAFIAEYLTGNVTPLSRSVAAFVWEMDTVYRKYCDDMRGLYTDFFASAEIVYPHILFPTYERPFMAMPDPNPEDGNSEVHNVSMAEEEFLLTVQSAGAGKIRITEIQVPCEWEMHPVFQPHDEPMPCECMDEEGLPDEDCPSCKGTGMVVCPICLGMGWMEIAPNPITDDIIEDSERYRQLVPALYDMDEEE